MTYFMTPAGGHSFGGSRSVCLLNATASMFFSCPPWVVLVRGSVQEVCRLVSGSRPNIPSGSGFEKFMSMKKAAHSQENGRPLFSKGAFRSEATLPAVALSHPSLLLAPARVLGLAPAAAPDSRAQLVSFAQPFVVLLSSFFERAWLWTSPCDAIVTFSSWFLSERGCHLWLLHNELRKLSNDL